MRGLTTGTPVIVNLGSPREQVFGVIGHIDAAGVLLRAIGIDGVDDWLRSTAAGRADDESPAISLAMTFFPMHRIEKIVLDEPSPGVPSVQERFLERVGVGLKEHVHEVHPDVAPEA